MYPSCLHSRLRELRANHVREFSAVFNVRRIGSAARSPCSHGDRERGFSLDFQHKGKNIHILQASFSIITNFVSVTIVSVQSHILQLVSVCRWMGVQTCKESMIRSLQVGLALSGTSN